MTTGNQTVDAAIQIATGDLQQACNAAGASQATCTAAAVTYFRAVMSAKLSVSPALDIGNEIAALESLGQSV